jgi:SAM-dependent methyltransferase
MLKNDSTTTLFDVGCCFGQDMRKLVLDGVMPAQVVGLDLVPKFHELGKELFRDGDKLELEFYVRDILDDAADWKPLENRFDVLHLTSFLHIWNWDGQMKAAERLIKLVKPRAGSLLVGSGLGTTVSGEFPNLRVRARTFVRAMSLLPSSRRRWVSGLRRCGE